MSWIGQQYQKYKNGIIFTLIFHIIIFIILNITQFKVKKEYKEAEILISFPEEMIQAEKKTNIQDERLHNQSGNQTKTNIASNKSIDRHNKIFDDAYQKELQAAQNLVKNVSKQLSKEIPTIDNLQMPEETTEQMNRDSILKKRYNGDSNVEYFLKDRFHVRLPIPVYLSQYGGQVTVNIEVDRSGNVIEANPLISNYTNDQLLSYAKTAALRTKFNPVNTGELKQKGYIKYTFVAQ